MVGLAILLPSKQSKRILKERAESFSLKPAFFGAWLVLRSKKPKSIKEGMIESQPLTAREITTPRALSMDSRKFGCVLMSFHNNVSVKEVFRSQERKWNGKLTVVPVGLSASPVVASSLDGGRKKEIEGLLGEHLDTGDGEHDSDQIGCDPGLLFGDDGQVLFSEFLCWCCIRL